METWGSLYSQAAQTLSLAVPTAALTLLLPASVHSSPHCHTLLLCSFTRHALPAASALLVRSFPSFLMHSLTQPVSSVTTVCQALSRGRGVAVRKAQFLPTEDVSQGGEADEEVVHYSAVKGQCRY